MYIGKDEAPCVVFGAADIEVDNQVLLLLLAQEFDPASQIGERGTVIWLSHENVSSSLVVDKVQ